MSWPYTIGWIVVVAAGLALEAAALIRKGKGDTFSENTWALLRKSPVIWFLALGTFLWLGVHFFGFGRVDDWMRGW